MTNTLPQPAGSFQSLVNKILVSNWLFGSAFAILLLWTFPSVALGSQWLPYLLGSSYAPVGWEQSADMGVNAVAFGMVGASMRATNGPVAGLLPQLAALICLLRAVCSLVPWMFG
jgi:hypothetical protein